MSSTDLSTLKNGNKRAEGRHAGSKNKAQLALQQIGEDNATSLLQMQIQRGLEGDEDAQRFVIDKIMPNAKGGRHIKIELPSISKIEDILPVQNIVMKNICDGHISLEEGEKLIAIIENQRKTAEMTEMFVLIQGIDKRMKDAGI